MTLPVSSFDFEYPEELIADKPAEPRDESRLLVLNRAQDSREHARFRDLPKFLVPGDCLVLNRTKVLSCRLSGKKSTGGKADLLLVKEISPGRWTALASGLKRGGRLEFPENLSAEVTGLTDEGEYELKFSRPDIPAYLEKNGLTPLPPYILKKKKKQTTPYDIERYQTVYARDQGSIAAPTAGLHFTQGLLETLKNKGIKIAYVTLHVGRGTFRPITSEDAAAHKMLAESYRMDDLDALLVAQAAKAGRRVLAVGTTATRTLETLARRPEGFGPGEGESELYLYPGSEFKIVGALITNFHLPRSTPLMLASAFAGREKLLAAYREAIGLRYRLYSYGDAMLIL